MIVPGEASLIEPSGANDVLWRKKLIGRCALQMERRLLGSNIRAALAFFFFSFISSRALSVAAV
jgi:hypothetical protein